MHRLSSKSSVYRFRVSAFLLCLRYVLVFSTGGVIFYSILIADRNLTLIGIGLGAITCFSVIIQWMLAAKTRCPLCLTPVLSTKKMFNTSERPDLDGKPPPSCRVTHSFPGKFRLPLLL